MGEQHDFIKTGCNGGRVPTIDQLLKGRVNRSVSERCNPFSTKMPAQTSPDHPATHHEAPEQSVKE